MADSCWIVTCVGRQRAFCVFAFLIALMTSGDVRRSNAVSAITSDVIWVRGHNTIEALRMKLKGGVTYLALDVTKKGDGPVYLADLQGQSSNLTLETWLEAVLSEGRTVRGVKVNILNSDAIEPTLDILATHNNTMHFSVWIGAAILPVHNSNSWNVTEMQTSTVDAQRFLDEVDKRLPSAILSVGWSYPSAENISEFTWETVRDMAVLLRCREVGSALTFDIWLEVLNGSLPQIRWLTESFPNSTVNIWNQPLDDFEVNVTAVLQLLKQLGDVRVSFELPRYMMDAVISDWNSVVSPVTPPDPVFDPEGWRLFPGAADVFENDMSCFLGPYVTSNTLLVNGGETGVVLVTRPVLVPATLSGELSFLEYVIKPTFSSLLRPFSGMFTIFAIPAKKLPSQLDTVQTDPLLKLVLTAVKVTMTVQAGDIPPSEEACPIGIRMQIGKTGYVSMTDMCQRTNWTQEINETHGFKNGEHLVFGFLFSGWNGFVLDEVTIKHEIVSSASRTDAVALVLCLLLAIFVPR